MRYLLTSLFLITIIMFISCDKNKSQPDLSFISNNKNCKTEIQLSFTNCTKINEDIEYFINSAGFGILTKNNNFCILDKSDYSIKKYNDSSKLIKQTGQKGQGPGEFLYPTEFYSIKDSLYVFDSKKFKFLKYSTQNLDFINEIPNDDNLIYNNLKSNGKNRIVGNIYKIEQIENKYFFVFNLVIMDEKLNILDTLKTNKLEYQPDKPINPFEYPVYNFAVDSTTLYVIERSSSIYQIQLFDLYSGKLKGKINRNFIKIPYSQKELDSYNKSLNQMMAEFNVEFNAEERYKMAITSVFIDKYNNLWVSSPSNEFGFFDLYSKNKLKGKITLNTSRFPKGSKIDFRKDKIIIYYDNEQIAIYDYDYKL